MNNEDKPKIRKPMSKETKAKISAARRARVHQPREGQSKKRQSFYQELMSDYKGNREACKWLREHRDELHAGGHQMAKELGIITEYHDTRIHFNEFKLSNLIFGKNAATGLEEGHDLYSEDNYDLEQEEEFEFEEPEEFASWILDEEEDDE